ncbi:uncharacterized protein [Bemisia tabaci]
MKVRFPDYNSDLLNNTAMFFNPFFKTALMEVHMKNLIIDKVKKLALAKRVAIQDSTIEDDTQMENPTESISKSKSRLWSSINEVMDQNLADVITENPNEEIIKEIEAYLNEKVTRSKDKESDPMEWWRCNSGKFPSLASVAKNFLCILATSVSSERVCSTAGNTVSIRRQCLSPLTAPMLIFIHQNYGKL